MAKPPIRTAKTTPQTKANVRQQDKIKLRMKPGAEPVARPAPRQPKKSNAATIRGLSINQMLRETTARTREILRGSDIGVTGIKPLGRGNILLCSTVTHKKTGNSEYKQVIENLDRDEPRFSRSKQIKVECTCEQFKYTHDWTLHQKNASDLRHSTDEPSNIRNPLQLHGVCKHLLRVFQTLKESGR